MHGKNHHKAGSFGANVLALGLQRSNGGAVIATPESEPDLFRATIGGLGLTGVIEWVEIALVPIASAFLDVPDCAVRESRGVLVSGRRKRRLPRAYGRLGRLRDGSRARRAHGRELGLLRRACGSRRSFPPRRPVRFPWLRPEPHECACVQRILLLPAQDEGGPSDATRITILYPLDSIRSWNRLYGVRGMRQYQCVIPWGVERVALPALLAEIAGAGQPLFGGPEDIRRQALAGTPPPFRGPGRPSPSTSLIGATKPLPS